MFDNQALAALRAATMAMLKEAAPAPPPVDRSRIARNLLAIRQTLRRHRLPVAQVRAFAWHNWGRTKLSDCTPAELSLVKTLIKQQAQTYAD